MPCLLLQNIPDDITADSLTKAFAAQSPKSIHISGVNTLKVPNLRQSHHLIVNFSYTLYDFVLTR